MKMFSFALVSLVALMVIPNHVSLDLENAKVTYLHVSEKVEGSLTGVEANVHLHKGDWSHSHVSGSIDATTLTTGVKMRDKHLQAKGYFNTEEFGRMTFKSTKVEQAKEGVDVRGNLTIKGISKEIIWNFTESKTGMKATTTIYTNDFDIHTKKKREKSEVQITLDLPYK